MNSIIRFIRRIYIIPLVWWRFLPLSFRQWIRRTFKALIWAIVLFPVIIAVLYWLDKMNIPWKAAEDIDKLIGNNVTFFRGIHSWIYRLMNRWGELLTFVIGFLIGFLIPNRTERQTYQILQFIRGNLLDFPSVYTQVCKLLEEIAQDEESCFIIVSQSPLLGADIYTIDNNRFHKLITGRIAKRNRVVCLSPFGSNITNIDNNSSPLRNFYSSLARYKPSKRGAMVSYQAKRTADSMFNEAVDFIVDLTSNEETDVVFADNIPYQVFIGRKANGERKCIMLLNGWDAIKKHLPAGGFVSQDPTFLQLIEESIQILLGTHCNVYQIRQKHTKQILEKCRTYAGMLGSPKSPKEVNSKLIKTVKINNLEFDVYPYVFDPEISESMSVMVKATLKALTKVKSIPNVKKPIQVWDIGCGSGVLSVLAAMSGNVKVIAIDVNPFACKCTLMNAKKFRVDSNIHVIHNESTNPNDVFLNCSSCKADLILADLPFLNCHSFDYDQNLCFLKMAYLDSEQQLNIQVLNQANKYLNEHGFLVISFSDLESVEEFKEKIVALHWQIEEDISYHTNNHEWHAFILRHNNFSDHANIASS